MTAYDRWLIIRHMSRTTSELAAELASIDREVLLAVALVHAAEIIAAPLSSIAHGDEEAPGGLEAVTVGIAGSGLRDSLTRAIRAHGQTIQSAADALNQIAGLLAKEVRDDGK